MEQAAFLHEKINVKSSIDGGYITEWLVLGPFFPSDLETDFLATFGEPKEGDTVTTASGTTLMWKRYKSKGNIINLLDAVGNYESATAYAFCVLQSEPSPPDPLPEGEGGGGDAQIYLGSYGSVTVWINGQQVYNNSGERALILEQDVFEVNLKAGANLCLVKASQGAWGWGFAMRGKMLLESRAVISGLITDEKGQPISKAYVRLELAEHPGLFENSSEVAQTWTDISGNYRLDVYPVREVYDLSAANGDLGNWQLSIRLRERECLRLNLTLKKALSIEETVLCLDNTPHVAVPVQAIRISDKANHNAQFVAAAMLSDEGGVYRFINLKPGKYKVRCQIPEGYIYYGEDKNHVSLPPLKIPLPPFSKGEGAGGFTFHALRNTQYGDILHVEPHKTLSNINFRIAPFKKGTWKNYNFFDGLAHNFVYAIHRAPDGVMWFGTRGGISVYDGKDFVNFTIKDGLADNRVISIHQSPDGMMWFGTEGGVSRHDGNQFVNFTIKDGLAHNYVTAIHSAPCPHGRDREGGIWFGTLGGGVSRYDGERFVNFTMEDGLANNKVISIYGSHDGVMWFGTDGGGVSRYDGKDFVNFTTKDGLADNRVISIHQDSSDVMWFGTWGGVSRYDGKTFVNFTQKDGLAHNIVHAIDCFSLLRSSQRFAPCNSPDGVMWFGTRDGGVSQCDLSVICSNDLNRYMDGSSLVNFTTKDGLAHNFVSAIYRAPDGVMWFGTSNGVSRYDGKEFVNFTQKDGLAHRYVFAIHQDSSGVMWFGTYDGVSRYDGNQFINFTTKDGLAHNEVDVIHCAPDGALWFGTQGGVSQYDGNQFINFTTKDGLAHNKVDVIHCAPDGALWFGTQGGVSRGVYPEERRDGKKFLNFTQKDGLAHNYVPAIHSTPDGVMWFGTWGGGVSRYDGKEFVNFTTTDGLANNFIWTIYRASDGVIWFGTWGGGVSGYDGRTWTSLDTRDGLAGNIVKGIHQDSDGTFWFATDGGITRYRKSAVLPRIRIVSARTEQLHTELVVSRPERSGAKELERSGVTRSQLRGVAVVPDDGAERRSNGAPLDGTEPVHYRAPNYELTLTAGRNVVIEYSAIDFKTLPQKRQYRYRIKEIDADWRPPTKVTAFEWTPEKSGSYTFEVQAIDRDLNYSEPASVQFQVQPDPRDVTIAALQTEVDHLRREVGRKYYFEELIGRSSPMKQVYALMEKAIDAGLTVLLSGETGTGKELVAKAIHYNSSRRNNPLLELNSGAVPKELVASTLFGHRKGAFTGAHEDSIGLFEAALGGTVILDEIGEMPMEAQVHLLRALQERKIQRVGETRLRQIDVRIIAITNRDLEADMKAGRFREDLYYRLNVFPIHMPPLRERLDDILLLAEHFLEKVSQELRKQIDGFGEGVMEMLQSYSWPGNVRELENEIARAAAFVEEGLKIQRYHFSSKLTKGESLIEDVLSEGTGYSEAVDRFRQRLIKQILDECGGNRHEAARRLGIDRSNLVALMRRLGIEN